MLHTINLGNHLSLYELGNWSEKVDKNPQECYCGDSVRLGVGAWAHSQEPSKSLFTQNLGSMPGQSFLNLVLSVPVKHIQDDAGKRVFV